LGITNLVITLRDKCSGASTRTFEIFDAATATWVVLDQRTLSGGEILVVLTPPGPAANYVSASGVLTVRSRTLRNGSLQRHRTDLVQVQYNSP
jgi:hypothetical protein